MCRLAARIPEVFLHLLLSELRKVTHLMWVNPRPRKSITVATAVVRNTFDGMRVATFKGGDERDSVRRE